MTIQTILDRLHSIDGLQGAISPEVAVVSLIVIVVLSWLLAYAMQGDAGDATNSVVSTASGLIMGIAAVIVVTISEFSALVTEAPGFAASIIISAVGYLTIDGQLGLAASAFLFVAGSAIVGALIAREA